MAFPNLEFEIGQGHQLQLASLSCNNIQSQQLTKNPTTIVHPMQWGTSGSAVGADSQMLYLLGQTGVNISALGAVAGATTTGPANFGSVRVYLPTGSYQIYNTINTGGFGGILTCTVKVGNTTLNNTTFDTYNAMPAIALPWNLNFFVPPLASGQNPIPVDINFSTINSTGGTSWVAFWDMINIIALSN